MNTQIYLIAEKPRADKVKNALSKFGKISVLSNVDDLVKLNNSDEKVIGVAPGLIGWKLPNDVLDRVENLKGICTLSAWAHYIDLEYCQKKKIVVTNTPGANSQSVAEYAIWMMFSLAKKLPIQISDSFIANDDEEHKQIEITGKTMGIVGLGNVGGRIAKMGKGLGMRVIYWSPKTRNDSFEYRTLEETLKEADFLFNCVETYEGTNNLLNSENLSLMKTEAYFISVLGGMGWGPEDDVYLVKAVNEKRLAGFAVEGEHELKFVVPIIEKNSNIFIPGAYAYFTHEAEKLSLQKWVEAIEGVVTGSYKHRVV